MTDTPATLRRPDLPRTTIGVLFIVALIASTVWILRLAFGLIGIFVGPVVLAVSYTLLGPGLASGRAPSPGTRFNDSSRRDMMRA